MKSISIILIFLSVILQSQNDPFDIELEPVSIDSLSGIQSYAFAQHDNKWILIGGRLDGLHRRQPWASFDIAGHNNQIIIVDPINSQVWKKD